MAICYNCNQKIGIFANHRKILGEKLCDSCVTLLGINNCLTTDESVYPEKHFSDISNFIQVLKDRKPLYDQMATAFKSTREYKNLGSSGKLDIEIDEQSQIICISRLNSRQFFRFFDFIGLTGTVGKHYMFRYKMFENENSFFIDTYAQELENALVFFNGIKPELSGGTTE
jgi:hypothetical protein